MWIYINFAFIYALSIKADPIQEESSKPTLFASLALQTECSNNNCDSKRNRVFDDYNLFLQDSTNPLERDISDIPESIDDFGNEYTDGDVNFLLATSFMDNDIGTGKLWVIPLKTEDIEDAYTLITGLNKPTGSCLDINHDFLYICDKGEETGYIYQYEVT